MVRARSFVSAFASVFAATASISTVSGFQVGSGGRVMWDNDCDLYGQDIYSVKAGPESCGDLCVDDSSCTHWAWSSYNGGTCWLKDGSEGNKVSPNAGTGCGYVIGRFTENSAASTSSEATPTPTSTTTTTATATPTVTLTPTPTPGFQVGSGGRVMWDNDCDLYGQDIYSVKAGPESCGDLCVDDSSCTHWAWSSYNGGTCWLKDGSEGNKVSPNAGTGCGYVIGRFTENSAASTSSEATPTPTSTPTTTPTPTPTTTTTLASSSTPEQISQSILFDNGLSEDENTEMLDRINAYRAWNNLSPLTIDSRIMAAAMVHSEDQAQNCTMSHTGTDGSHAWDRMKEQGYDYWTVAENVAAGYKNVSSVMTAWWNSEGHRANILRSELQHVGFALAKNSACSKYPTFWTQDFGSLRE